MKIKQDYCVLVVDDMVDNLILLQFILEAEGYQVELATSGSIALSKVETSLPDLVLLDLMMPEMNGLEVAQHLRETQDLLLLPILLVTADLEINAEQALAVGVNDVIRKPIDMDDLVARVDNFCRSRPSS